MLLPSIPYLLYAARIDITLAATADTIGTAPDIAVLGQYGLLGLLCGLLLWFVKGVWARETARSDRLEAELLKLHTLVQERHIPALETAARAIEQYSALVRDQQQADHGNRRRRGEDT